MFKDRLLVLAVDEAHCISEWFVFWGNQNHNVSYNYCTGEKISVRHFQTLEDYEPFLMSL